MKIESIQIKGETFTNLKDLVIWLLSEADPKLTPRDIASSLKDYNNRIFKP